MRKTILALVLVAAPAAASEMDRVDPVRDPLTKKECGSCHMAFQPELLPASAWRAVMADLSKHYGDDASLPADKTAAIREYLIANAGSERWRQLGPDLPRITEAGWFQRKHRKIAERTWKDPKVVTRSNCPACHVDAERGYYEDD
jgi:nitrate/TMAO reductase-like tetraheme cytochrome c subunit